MATDIIYAPVITEKTSALAGNNTYVFKVAKDANKIQIKNAIEEAFGVKVCIKKCLSVITQHKGCSPLLFFRKGKHLFFIIFIIKTCFPSSV